MAGFLTWLIMMIMWLGSVTFGVIAAAAMVTYVRRTWQLTRADEDGSNLEQILDGIERLETRLDLLGERLSVIESGEAPVHSLPPRASGPEGSQAGSEQLDEVQEL